MAFVFSGTARPISSLPVDAGGFKITAVGTPTAGTDAANKAYADSIAGGSGGWTQTATVVHLTTGTDTVAIGAAAMSAAEKVRIVGDTLVEGKLTVTGVLDPTALVLTDPLVTQDLFFESADGSVAGLSAGNTGRIRYNDGAGQWEQSVQGGAYTPLGGGASNAFVQGGNAFAADAILGTTDAFDLTIVTVGAEISRFTQAGQLLVGTTTQFNGEIVGQFQTSANGERSLLMRNSNTGTLGQSSVSVRNNVAEGTLTITSTGFTPAGGKLANEVVLYSGGTATGLRLLTDSGTQPIMFSLNNAEIGRLHTDADLLLGQTTHSDTNAIIDVTRTVNATLSVRAQNQNSGTVTKTEFRAENQAGSSCAMTMGVTAGSFTTSGLLQGQMAYLRFAPGDIGPTGLLIDNQGADTIFGMDGTRRMSIGAFGAPVRVGPGTGGTGGFVIDTTIDQIQSITRGAAAQTANLDEWQDSTSAMLVSVNAAGNVIFSDVDHTVGYNSAGARNLILDNIGAGTLAAVLPGTHNETDFGATGTRFKQGWFQGTVTTAATFVSGATITIDGTTNPATMTGSTAMTVTATGGELRHEATGANIVSVYNNGTETSRYTDTHEFLVGLTSTINSETLAAFQRNQDSVTGVQLRNTSGGASAQSEFGMFNGGGVEGAISLASTGFVNGGTGVNANDVVVYAGGPPTSALKLLTNQTIEPIIFSPGRGAIAPGTTSLGTARFLGTGEFIYGAATLIGTEKFRITGGTTIADFTSATAFQVTKTGGTNPVLIVDTTNGPSTIKGRVGIDVAPTTTFHAKKDNSGATDDGKACGLFEYLPGTQGTGAAADINAVTYRRDDADTATYTYQTWEAEDSLLAGFKTIARIGARTDIALAATYTGRLDFFLNLANTVTNVTRLGATTEATGVFDWKPATAGQGNLGTSALPWKRNWTENGIGNGTLFTQTADTTISNSAAETTLTNTGTGSLTLAANLLSVAKTIRVRAKGYVADTGTPTLTIKVKFGATVITSTGAATLTSLTGNREWSLDTTITCRTTGAGGTVAAQGDFNILSGTATDLLGMVNTATVSVNTTTTQAITVTAQWGAADPANSITCTNLSVEAAV